MAGDTETYNGQVFDVLKPEDRPQDTYMDGSDLRFEASEHGGDEPDVMPQAITITDAQGRWAVYVPLEINGKIVRPRPEDATKRRHERSGAVRARDPA